MFGQVQGKLLTYRVSCHSPKWVSCDGIDLAEGVRVSGNRDSDPPSSNHLTGSIINGGHIVKRARINPGASECHPEGDVPRSASVQASAIRRLSVLTAPRRIASTKQDHLLPHVEDRCFCESLSATQPQSQSDSRIERCTCVSKHFHLAQSALTEPLTSMTSCSTEATSVSARKNRPKGSVTGLGIHRSR
jgi:hypothetical protein